MNEGVVKELMKVDISEAFIQSFVSKRKQGFLIKMISHDLGILNFAFWKRLSNDTIFAFWLNQLDRVNYIVEAFCSGLLIDW